MASVRLDRLGVQKFQLPCNCALCGERSVLHRELCLGWYPWRLVLCAALLMASIYLGAFVVAAMEGAPAGFLVLLTAFLVLVVAPSHAKEIWIGVPLCPKHLDYHGYLPVFTLHCSTALLVGFLFGFAVAPEITWPIALAAVGIWAATFLYCRSRVIRLGDLTAGTMTLTGVCEKLADACREEKICRILRD
jgi:hypothetical protein